ncbi:hypothetical protein Q9R32_05695 [Actinotalea sp. AC32]|nr:hypothetical protein [Actinotalea sp. AC32]
MDRDAPVTGGEDEAAVPGPTTPTAPVDEVEASQEVMSLLSEHVPLALLADLAIPEGPQSPQILSEEGLPEVAWWEGGEHAEDGAPAV